MKLEDKDDLDNSGGSTGNGPYGYTPRGTETALKKYWPFIGIGILILVGVIGSCSGYI